MTYLQNSKTRNFYLIFPALWWAIGTCYFCNFLLTPPLVGGSINRRRVDLDIEVHSPAKFDPLRNFLFFLFWPNFAWITSFKDLSIDLMTLHMSEITYKGHTTTFKISNFFDFFLPKKTPLFFRRKYFLKQSILNIKERFFLWWKI